MRIIQSWNDLGSYGIRLLTAEACGLTYRYLCDATEQGKRIIERCFDVKVELAEAWNSGALGSIMLPPDMLVPLSVFALLESGCSEVWLKDAVLIGVEANDAPESVERVRRGAVRRFAYEGTAGSRNRHEFSGRIT